MESIFGNMDSLGLLKNNPFGQLKYEKPRSEANHDMLRPEDLKKLFESALHIDDMDINEVRILVFMLLSYDTAMRCGEVLLLNTEDFIFENDDDVTLLLKGENQKGNNKMSRYLILLFPEVRELLKKYLRDIRPQFSPKDDALFLNRMGERIKANQINVSLKEFSTKLGILTFNSKSLTSHIFRHTFASLNIAPLGLRLNLDQVITRLRHKDRALAEKVYILDNPYVEKMKHKERMSLLNETRHERFLGIPKAVFMGWVKDELKLKDALLNKLDEAHDKFNPVNFVKQAPKLTDKKLISEEDALGLLKGFGVTLNSFRGYCVKNKLCSEYNGSFKYDEEFIWDLRNNYESREDALKKMNISIASFYRLKGDLDLISIGNTPLVRRSAVLSYLSKQ